MMEVLGMHGAVILALVLIMIFQVSVKIIYFNASTNASGGYNYNITIPSDYLGVQPLEISVSSGQNIDGRNTTNITVWSETNIEYSTRKNYTASLTNYSVSINYTRNDLDSLINGTINISITNNAYAGS